MEMQINTNNIELVTQEVLFDTNPNAGQLYNEVLQGYGYTMTDGLGDIIDNSLDAGAENVKVVFKQAPGRRSKATGGSYV